MDQNFDVGLSAKAVSFCLEIFSQLAIIENLTITAQHERSIFVEQRLITRFEIYYAQPPRANRDIRIDKIPTRIRPAMNQRISHTLKNFFFNSPGVEKINITNYPAHNLKQSV